MQKARREGHALKSPAAWARLLAIVAVGTSLDLFSKAWAWRALRLPGDAPADDPSGSIAAFLPTIDLLWQRNYGAVFGAGAHKVAFLVIFTIAALVLLVWLFADSGRRQIWLQSALALIIAGALGNLHDRLLYGHVRDFIRFNVAADWVSWGGPGNRLIWPYVFNVADVFITAGVAALFFIWIASWIRRPAPDGQRSDASARTPASKN